MPTYSFRCRKCGHEFDELVAHFGDKKPCPSCGSEDVERLISAPATRVGSGLHDRLPSAGGCGPGRGFS